MVYNKFPPRGYRSAEFPQPHAFGYDFSLSAEDETKNSTICTLLRTSQAQAAVENIEVNPKHTSFSIDPGPLISLESIVPRMKLSIKAHLTKGAIETDAMRFLRFTWFPIYGAFKNTWDATDEDSSQAITDVLELQYDTTNKDVYPLFANVDLTGVGTVVQPLSTVIGSEAFGDYGLTTDTVLESVAWSPYYLTNGLNFHTNREMLKKTVGNIQNVTVTRDRPYMYYSNNFTNPRVKRGLDYTFCGLLFHLEQGGSMHQLFGLADTTAIDHLRIQVRCRYDEWNPQFDQTAD